MDANPASADMYERLGVAPDATPEQVKTAFRAMRKELHPDSRPPSLRGHFDAMMKNVNEAHQTLADPRARAKYDARRSYRAQTQDARRDDAQGQAERQRQEEARRQQQAEQQRREAEERRRREEEERLRQEEEARGADDDAEWYWTEEDEEPAARDAAGEPQPAATSAGDFLDKLPGPVQRVMIYTAGSWVWLGVAVLLWNLPVFGAEFVALLVALGVPLISGVVLLKTAFALPAVERIVGFLMPTQGRFTIVWYSRRVLESAVLAPVFLILAGFLSWVWVLLSLCALGYVVLWGVEFYRWRQRRQEVGG